MTVHTKAQRPLHDMFTKVPPMYDILNRILTFGMDEAWRKQLVKICLENNPEKVLDLCTGTGDLVFRLKKNALQKTTIKALDYSLPMLELAGKKANQKNIKGIEFIHGDAANMPFDSNYFDSIGISFAFRNLTYQNPDRDKFLLEILRVLKPGGRLVIVETSQPKNKIIRKLYHWQLRWITAPIGGLFSGQYNAYKYLAHSATNFYNEKELSELLIKSGFLTVTAYPQFFGVSTIYKALK